MTQQKTNKPILSNKRTIALLIKVAALLSIQF